MSNLARAIREMAHDYRRRARRAGRLSRGFLCRDVTERLIRYAKWHERTAAEREQMVDVWEPTDDPEAPRRAAARLSASPSQGGVPGL
jgi:hypothetical protein